MSSIFKKLRSGQIIFVLEVNLSDGVLHGINLLSSGLRIHNYKLSQFDPTWISDVAEINKQFSATTYCFRQSKHVDNAEIFGNRHTVLKNAVYAIQHVYKKTG